MIRLKSRIFFILYLTILLLIVGLLSFYEVLERTDSAFYDKVSSIPQYSSSNNVVIVAIDDESLQALGRWPWSRKIHAEFINRLAHRDNVIALDLLFLERDENDPSADSELGAAIATHGSVVLPVVPVIDAHFKTLSLAEQLPFLRENAMLGHADIELDNDGVARRVFLAAGIDAPKWPALGLALASQTNRQDTIDLPNIINDGETSKKGSWVRSHEVLIPYVGPPGSFQKVSYAQILHDDAMVASLNGKTIIVGVTAAEIGVLLATPVSPINRQPMSGVEWHANVYEMLQHNRAVSPASNIASSLISMFWLLIILLSIHLMRIDFTIPTLLVLLACSLLIIGFSIRWLQIWIPPSAALFGLLAIYPLWNWQLINKH